MKMSRYTEEQIVGVLTESEAGTETAELCRKHASANRWDEEAGLRRDAICSQVIDALYAQGTRRPAMQKLTTTTVRRTRKDQDRKLTIGLDLGDRSSFYCVLDEAGRIIRE
jgi:hypothetical protein